MDQPYFVISNYNYDPSELVLKCKYFELHDQSDDPRYVALINEKYPDAYRAKHVGHNLGDYFNFIVQYWDSLPDVIAFSKGNMLKRHISSDYFDQVKFRMEYTMLYSDPAYSNNEYGSGVLADSSFIELNNSWYVDSRPHEYFGSYNSALHFLFQVQFDPHWICFSPGGCMIVERERILKYPKSFFEALSYLVTYRFFPSEAYVVERMLHTIFFGNLPIQDYMNSYDDFYTQLNKVKHQTNFIQRAAFGRRLVTRIARTVLKVNQT